MNEKIDPYKARRRIRDLSMALLLIGIGVLLPPIAGISLIDTKIFGVPMPLLYVFFVWAILICGAALLARPLRDSDPSAKTIEDNSTTT